MVAVILFLLACALGVIVVAWILAIPSPARLAVVDASGFVAGAKIVISDGRGGCVFCVRRVIDGVSLSVQPGHPWLSRRRAGR